MMLQLEIVIVNTFPEYHGASQLLKLRPMPPSLATAALMRSSKAVRYSVSLTAKGVSRGADPVCIDDWHLLQHVDSAIRIPKHLVHAERVGPSLLEFRSNFFKGAGVLP